MLLDALYHKKHEYVWFSGGDLNGYCNIYDFKNWLGLGMPLYLPLSLGLQISNFLAKLYINIIQIKPLTNPFQWLVRNSLVKIVRVVGMPVGQP